ncbi:GCR1-dependent translation factor 1 [Rhizina undulata]
MKLSPPLLLVLLSSLPHLVPAAKNPAPAEYPPPLSDSPAVEAIVKPEIPKNKPANSNKGTADAPVDGLDGKPHDGPGLYPENTKTGTGDVGVSGGGASVDITKPPPHTGEHEIVDIENPSEGDDSQLKLALQDNDSPLGAGSSNAISSSSNQHKEYTGSQTSTQSDPPVLTPPHLQTEEPGENSSISQPLHSFALSFVMIIFSEIGDKTFLIAALMAMKHPRVLVFTAALSSLILMSILSALLGHAVPTLIPKKFTNLLAGLLFLVFGVKMIREGLAMPKGTAQAQEELAEVEAELLEKSSNSLESGLHPHSYGRPHSSHLRRSTSSPSLSDSDEDEYARARGAQKKVGFLEGIANLAGLLLSPAWVQTFVMTFLGEWGDRSQIATIAMAAGQDYWFVTVGAVTGHAVCTGGAVIGGRMLASKISVRNVTFGGAGAFLVFGVIYLAEALYF